MVAEREGEENGATGGGEAGSREAGDVAGERANSPAGLWDEPRGGGERMFANGLLLAAVAGFAATFLTPEPDFWVLFARHVAEASVAGGVADWFAVTALFRRPLGLPIPHTGIIPRNQERIARGIARFVENHFLDPATIAGRLRSADLSGLAAHWLSKPGNAAAVADRLISTLATVLAAVPEAEVQRYVRRAGLRGLSSLDLTALLCLVAEATFESGRHQQLVDAAVLALRRWMRENPSGVAELVAERTSWWVPRFVDRGLGRAAQEWLVMLLADLEQPDSDSRADIDRLTAKLVARLQTSPSTRREVERLQRELIASDEVAGWLDGAAEDLRRQLLEAMAERPSALREAVAGMIAGYGAKLSADEGLRKRLERRFVWVVRGAVRPWRPTIGRFIADVTRSWETRTLSQRMENAVGRDLQYVRINGTLVGGLVGGLLFLLTHGLR